MYRISEYMTSGIINHRLKNYLRRSDRYFDINTELTDNEFKRLVLEDYIGVNVFLCICLSICSLIFIIENIIALNSIVFSLRVLSEFQN